MKYDFDLDLKTRNSLSLLLERIRPNSAVLEFGPANGRMTKYLKEKLNCKVYAVELDEKSAKDVSNYTEKIIVDNIENYNWKKEFADMQFDYIIFADVLEHLIHPKKVLESVCDFLKDDGSILISIPNIAHNAIILSLLKNEFNYSDTGLLDDTHMRFFTKKTFDDLIQKAGYFRAYETAVFISPKDTEFGIDYDDVETEVGNYLSKLPLGEIYQLIYEVKKDRVDLVSDFIQDYKVYSKFYSQLFVDSGNGFDEDISSKFFVNENSNEIQVFTFDLANYENIINIRIDPLNEICVIKIDEVTLIKQDNSKIDLITKISSNACFNNEKDYFFDNNDSQIYFEKIKSNEFENSKQLIVSLKFLHVGKDALEECLNKKDQKLELMQNMQNNLSDELNDIYSSKSWKLIMKVHSFFALLKK